MRLIHILLAILVMAIWGLSFVVIDIGLKDTSPLLLCAFRFLFTTFPAIFFIRKPPVSWAILFGYGFFMFVLMFSCTFFSLRSGLSPGLASLLLQIQIFFTILLSAIFFKESVTRWQIIGMIFSLSGLVVVGFHVGGEVNLESLLFIISSALAWGVANLMSKKAGKINMVALIVWGSLIAWPFLFAASVLSEGFSPVLHQVQHLSVRTFSSIIYMAYPATILGFSLWGFLLNKYKAAVVTPFALLVPIFGMLSSVLVFHENLSSWKIIAGLLVIGGLGFNLLGARLVEFLRQCKTFQRKCPSR
jgi:O-acetylserine/cysteine efflux transporter